MTIKYASLLAATKFRTRLGRSIVTIVAASLVASIMLIASFVMAGINGSISGISQTPISKLNVARENIFSASPVRVTKPSTTPNPATQTVPPAMTLAEYKASIAKYNPQAVYIDQAIGGFTLTDPTLPQNAQATESLTARTDSLYTASLDVTTPLPAVTGTLPAAISSDIVLALEGITFSDTDSAAYKVTQTLTAENAWRGKVLTLAATDPAFGSPTIKVTAVGFLSSSGLFGEGTANTILLPMSLASTLKGFPSGTQDNTTYYASFSTQSAAMNFVENERSKRDTTDNFHAVSIYGNPLLQLQEFEDQILNILKYVIIVLLVSVVLAMMTTLSKIIADSERETGVFRAIGARVTDILQIYFSYSTLISILAMLLAIALASGVAEFLTKRFSENLTYTLISISGSSNLTGHVTLFGVNWLQLGEVFLAIFFAAILGAIVPLITLLRRDPIKALRSE